jgi:predicted DNA-binding transcriptional regulator AlpA
MTTFSTRQVAKKLGIDMSTLLRHIRLGKVPAPKSATSGGMTIHFWTEEEIEHIREMLPKIANGRKTRHKKQLAISTQQSTKAKKRTPARVPVPHKTKKK